MDKRTRFASFLAADDDLNDQIDAAYRDKYRRYVGATLGRITSPQARSMTIELVPGAAAS